MLCNRSVRVNGIFAASGIGDRDQCRPDRSGAYATKKYRSLVEAQYRNWTRDKAEPSNPHGAFINWAKTFVKKQAAAERDMAD
jgi:hypothetical protein